MNRTVTLLAGLLLLIPALSPRACQICVPFPKTSVADILLTGNTVVLAREDPDRPFHFKAIETLKGESDHGEIDLFLNSPIRRTLEMNPEQSVVLVKQTVDQKTIWHNVGIADKKYKSFVHDILKAGQTWKEQKRARILFFSQHLGSSHSAISKQSLLEVGRAPYSEIRKLGDALSREQLWSFLNNSRYIEWHALHILLLAQSKNAEDQQWIKKSFRSATQSDSTVRLAALATAAIELEGKKAVTFIEEQYFRNSTRTPKELSEIAKALSVHGTHGSAELQNQIVSSYGTLLKLNPGMTPQIAKDLIAWKRHEYAHQFDAFLKANPLSFELADSLELRAYIRRAQKNRNTPIAN